MKRKYPKTLPLLRALREKDFSPSNRNLTIHHLASTNDKDKALQEALRIVNSEKTEEEAMRKILKL